MQAQQMIEQLQQTNPLAEAELIKQQGAIKLGQDKNNTELLKVQEQSRLKEMEMIQNGAQFQAGLTMDYTKLELENGVDIAGQGQGR